MAINRSTAARLCTKPELEIVDASSAANLRQLTPGRLRQKATMARRLRDKYRDLARRQRLEARGKREPQRSRPARGNENTQRKAELFQEVLERFESRLDTHGGVTKAGAKKTGAKKAGAKKTGAKKTGAKKAGAKKAGAKKAGAKKAGAKKAGAKKAGAKKAGAKKAGAKKAGATKAAGPAGGQAVPSAPRRPGAAALKGARSRPSMEDRKMTGRGKTASSHNRSATRRQQISRDRRQS